MTPIRRPHRRKALRCGMALAMTALMVLGGCADQAVAYKKPAFGFFSRYTAARTATPVLLSNDLWWQRLDDPLLNDLVSLALKDNISLEIARARVVAAREARAAVPGAVLLSSSATAQTIGTRDPARDDSTLGGTLGLSWILDPYGARRGQLRAAGARIEAAEAEEDAARLLVLFNMANAYVTLRQTQQNLYQSRQELSRRQSTLALTRALKEAESATRLEVIRSQARVAEIRAELPTQEAAVIATFNEVAVLAGVVPGNLPKPLAAALIQSAPQPRASMSPDVGIPADLLRNRPDIHIAERRYYAAVADIGVARADLYPRLSLTGAITLNALGGASAGADYYFGPVVQFPSLPTTQTRAIVRSRHAAAREAHAAWKSTVLSAILEVENAMVAYRATSASLSSAGEARRLYRETLDLTRHVFEIGEATLSDLIIAEQAVYSADQVLIALRQQQALRFIELNIRLGAGHKASAS